MTFGGQVGCVTRANWFDFGEDLDLTTRIFESDSSPLIGPKMIYSMLS